jgi:hypothetical protein
MIRPLLLGLDNPHSADPRHALFPHPPGSAGHRLFKLSGMKWRKDYLDAFDRANVCDGPRVRRGRHVVVMGRAAWRRMGLPAAEWFATVGFRGSEWTLLPHPSGRCRIYNDPRARARARRILRSVVAEVGEVNDARTR